MKGRTMNLMPSSVKTRVEQTEARNRLVAVGLLAGSLLVGAWLYGGIRVSDAEDRRAVARDRAAEVLKAEGESRKLGEQLERMAVEIDSYRAVQLPFRISELLATIVNELPESVTFDRVDFDASSLVASPVRAGGTATSAPPRRLRGELEGIAADDVDVARLVDALRSRRPIDEVEVETSRHLRIGDHPARAFRIGFSIDLDAMHPKGPMILTAAGEGSGG
ncbi:MAG: hypothetical protein MK085_02510 [Phycisphaerales bacterium]|nr:hypothetical protein [Phycisphaerales bacterium]